MTVAVARRGGRARPGWVVAAVAVVAGVLGACTGDDDAAPTAQVTPPVPEVPDVRSAAADLRAGLTHLLQEHVFLTGSALFLAVSEAPDAPITAATAASLDRNTIALAALVEQHYGADASARFLLLWRAHIDRYVDYTVALAAGQGVEAAGAVAALDGFRQDIAVLLEEITGGTVASAAVAELLAGQVGAVLAVAGAVVDDDADVVAVLRQAAQRTHQPAAELAAGFDRDLRLDGDTDEPVARLRSELTALQQAHVYLTGSGWRVAAAAGPASDASRAAAAAIEANAAALGAAVAPHWGRVAAERFAALWADRGRLLVDVATVPAPAGGSDSRVARLAEVRTHLARLVAAETDESLTVDGVAAALGEQGADLLAAARDAGSPPAQAHLYEAAQLAPELALLVVAGIADHDPASLD